MPTRQHCIACQKRFDSLTDELCDSCRAGQFAKTVAPSATENPNDGSDREAPTVAPTTAPPQSAPVGSDTIGEYEIVEEIARGGMGVVYKAHHQKLNRVAALKMILGGRFSSPQELQRFQIEAESTAKLDHPNIVPIYEIGEADGNAFFAMKYIQGGTLANHIGSLKNRPAEAIDLLIKVAKAVHHAHQRGILHRDLKPANVLIDENNEPFLTDLGLAKSSAGDSNLTNTGAVIGTPSYMPPEQASGKGTTTAADIYSLGAIMYELLTGRPPHRGDSVVEVLMKVIDEVPDAPSKVNPSLDRDLELICLKCIDRNPDQRYSSALEFANDLENWSAGKAISIKPPSIVDSIRSWIKRNQRSVFGVFALAVAALFAALPILNVLSGDDMLVYEKFPADDRPLIYYLSGAPQVVSMTVLGIFLLVVWPMIGYMNTIFTRPSSFRGALFWGASSAIVLSVVLYFLVGWLVISTGARIMSGGSIDALAEAVWSPDGEQRDAAIEKVNSIYAGLDKIPREERAEVVAKRMRADIFAVAPTSLGWAVGFCVMVAFPVFYGTVIAYLLLRQSGRAWLKVLRYLIGWATFSILIFTVVLLLTGVVNLGDGNKTLLFVYPLECSIVIFVLVAILALTLRDWSRTSNDEKAVT